MGYSKDGPCLRFTLSFLKVKKYSSEDKTFWHNEKKINDE